MTKNEKAAIISAPAVGYVSAFGGIEIKSIEYGINDYVVFVAGAWCSAKSAHRAVIRYTENDSYFLYRGNRIKFSECLRT